MTTQEQNQQTIAEHIVNIDTTAENISAINSVANIVVQMVAVAGMLPDIAATVTIRSTLLAVAKKLAVVQSVADAVPLLEAVRNMESEIRAAIASRAEISAVVAHLEAVRSLAAQLDVLIQVPQHAAEAKLSAEAAAEAASQIASQMDRAETARLGAELAENRATASSETATASSENSAASAIEAKQAAAAAAAVSGLPDASAASAGDPLIWDGTHFAVGTLASSLSATNDGLAVAETVLESITTAQATADALDAKVTAAHSAATDAKTTAEAIDAKATQAAADATTAKNIAESASANANAFGARLSSAEAETMLLGEAQNEHSNNGDIHQSTVALVERINTAVSACLATIRDDGEGSLPETHNTLQKLAWLLDALQATVENFLRGEGDANRLAMLEAIDANRTAIANFQENLLLKSDISDNLTTTEPTKALSANQGVVLSGLINLAQRTAESAAMPWVKVLDTIPATWPETLNPYGLLLHYTVLDGAITNPKWYVNDRNIPVQLVLDAVGIRMLDGTTVQTGVASSLAASEAARTVAQTAQASAEQAKLDAEVAKITAEGVDAKATAAQSAATEAKNEALSAKADAAEAKATAEGVDAKATAAQSAATAAQSTATEAKATAEAIDAKATQAQADATEALAKTPDLATQTVPGIVKGSSTVTVDALGALHVAGGGSSGGGIFVGQWLFLRQTRLPIGYVELNGTLYTDASAKFPDLMAYLAANPEEITTETDWQSRSAAASGIGGVAFYVHDAVANTLRMPDTRGDSPYHGSVGTWEGDAIRQITGAWGDMDRGWYNGYETITGAFYLPQSGSGARPQMINSGKITSGLLFDSSRVVPTDSTNHPRRIGLTLAVYAGTIGA